MFLSGEFVRDESVEVEVFDRDDNMVFHAVYGEGDDFIRIDEEEPLYITNWHTEKEMEDEFIITVLFDPGLLASMSVTLI